MIGFVEVYMTNIDCPCENCICVPMCKNKSFMQLFNDCILMRIYEPRHSEASKRDPFHMLKIVDHLQPTTWSITMSSIPEGFALISPKPRRSSNLCIDATFRPHTVQTQIKEK